jgi:diacylglycerol kinase (ATP)
VTTCIIVNPRAGAGRAGKRAAAVARTLERLGINHRVSPTTKPGEAGKLAIEAREGGAELIVVVGGDGTLNEVVQAYVDAEGVPVPGPDLAVVPAGTGGDFRRTFDLEEHPERAVRRFLDASGRSVDLGVMRLVGDDGSELVRAFANIASFGVSGRIDRIVNAGPKWMGGQLAFFLGTARALAVYRNQPVSVEVDGEVWHEGRIVNVALANGRYFGGGMMVAPDADPSDGLLDVVAIGDLGLAESLGSTPRLYGGSHVTMPKVRVTRGRRIVARPLGTKNPILIDLDGEAPGRLPLTAWVLPGAIRLRVG